MPAQSEKSIPFLLTHQGGGVTPCVWLNGEFHPQLQTPFEPADMQSPQDLIEDEVSDPESVPSDSEAEEI